MKRGAPYLFRTVSEKDFQTHVVQYAKMTGWHHIYHTHDSRKSAAGFPDLVLVRKERLVFVELKRDGKQPRSAQKSWLTALGETPVEVYLWTPADWPEAQRVLR